MKKIIYFIICVILHCSCNDAINIDPDNAVTFVNYFKTEKDLEATAYGMHDLLRQKYMCSCNYPAILGSLATKANSGMEPLRERDPSYYTANNGSSDWQRFYDIISWANVIIENIDNAKSLTKERRDYYLGQAHFVRAFMYFRIVQTWGDVPLVKSTLDNGPKGKADWKEVLDYAIEDADKASKMLKPWAEQYDSNKNSLRTKQIPGKGTAYALLAHMHAWKAELGNETAHLDKAIQAATFVIDGDLKNGYSPEFSLASNPEQVCKSVVLGGHPESIFEGDFTYEELSSSNKTKHRHLEQTYQGWPHDPTGDKNDYKNNSLLISNDHVKEMYKGGDERRDAYFYKFEELENDTILEGWAVIQKRREAIMDISSGRQRFSNWKGNLIVFRLADIILLRAECYAKKGDNGKAIADLNTIRSRAKAPLYKHSEGELFYTIFKEREKELLLEKHRWFDCIRTGFWKTELSEPISKFTDQDIENGALYMPVYMTAFTNNTLMRQNKYWLGKW